MSTCEIRIHQQIQITWYKRRWKHCCKRRNDQTLIWRWNYQTRWIRSWCNRRSRQRRS